MPTQAIANQFTDRPGNFLKYNVVHWFGGYPPDQAVIRVAMIEGETIIGGRTIGRRRTSILQRKVDTPFYYLLHAANGSAPWELIRGDNPPTFDVIWSGYRAGQAVDAILPPVGGPGVMLTETLTGCSVVCSPNADGAVNARFSHYNLMNHGAGNTLERASMEAIAGAQYEGLGHRVLSKEHYNASAKHVAQCDVTVVGHRRGGRWEFWAQHLEDKPSGWQIRRVQKII